MGRGIRYERDLSGRSTKWPASKGTLLLRLVFPSSAELISAKQVKGDA